MELDIIPACGLNILAKNAFGKADALPDHDLIMLKNRQQRRLWEQKIKLHKPRLNHILELGIADGGSLPYIFEICDADFIAGVDILPEDPKIRSAYNRSSMEGKFSLNFETDQTDRAALNKIVADNFSGGLDMIIDDASHFLGNTRASFEILFPHLRPGGLYVIEDYTWSHNEAFAMIAAKRYSGQPMTSQLVLEFTMLMSTHQKWISRVVADYNTITVVKGPAKVPDPLSIKDNTVNWAPLQMTKLAGPH